MESQEQLLSQTNLKIFENVTSNLIAISITNLVMSRIASVLERRVWLNFSDVSNISRLSQIADVVHKRLGQF